MVFQTLKEHRDPFNLNSLCICKMILTIILTQYRVIMVKIHSIIHMTMNFVDIK